ncbi:hypothetical protein F4604DRAFT_1921855 [Suillus subluteus]|nr:hypothetical protein F4604DRAFT_1921855 [Suillus subluteus]
MAENIVCFEAMSVSSSNLTQSWSSQVYDLDACVHKTLILQLVLHIEILLLSCLVFLVAVMPEESACQEAQPNFKLAAYIGWLNAFVAGGISREDVISRIPDLRLMMFPRLLDAHPDLHTLIHAPSPPVHYWFGSIHLRTSIYPYLWTFAAKPASSILDPIGSKLIPPGTLPSLDYQTISIIHIPVLSSPRSPDLLIRYPDASSDISRPLDLTYTHIQSSNLKSASISLW